MGEKQVFVECGGLAFGACANAHRQGEPRKRGEGAEGLAVKSERHKGGPRGHDAVAKLLGEPMAPVGGADFGDGEASRGDHQLRTAYCAARGVQLEAVV